MLLQRTFKKNYAESLLDAVRNGQDLHKYAENYFVYDQDQVVMLPGIEYPEGLIEKMIPTPQGDCESAIALYEAYPELTPLQASDKAFWVYLSHADLFSFVQARYPKVKEENFDDIQYVISHWFFGEKWMYRHPIASLWWFVNQTIDKDNPEDKYKYTRFFFTQYEFRTNLIHFSMSRINEALFGYFDFLMDNPEIMSQFFKNRNRFVTKHLNKLGGVKLLSSLPRDFFYSELVNIKSQILDVTGSSDKDEDSENDFFFE